ncbi:hypothetical protein [Mesorhizobium liriopis]|uniref:hypothetical protein n=1 Tax=Mesorhizobium liriopis TaxID=2953882 RepID=UPI00209219E5|nr:hypothetical protein [Mesorhizobium liriopis]
MWQETDRHLSFSSGRKRSFRLACASCGTLVDDPAQGDAYRQALQERLEKREFTSDDEAGYGLDIYSLRSAATLFGKVVEPLDALQRNALSGPHASIAARARISDLAGKEPAAVSLGVICRAGEVPQVLRQSFVHQIWARELIVLVDSDAPPTLPDDRLDFGAMTVRIAARPLAGDFAGQRNTLQDLSSASWMLQLDADETLSAETGRSLSQLVALAERQGVVSVGLPRRNLVDGVLSAVYPDTQYRLNRRDIRFGGVVHERPERPWQQSLLALNGAILHHLERAHVLARSKRYEALSPGQGRLEEEQALLEPYRD